MCLNAHILVHTEKIISIQWQLTKGDSSSSTNKTISQLIFLNVKSIFTMKNKRSHLNVIRFHCLTVNYQVLDFLIFVFVYLWILMWALSLLILWNCFMQIFVELFNWRIIQNYYKTKIKYCWKNIKMYGTYNCNFLFNLSTSDIQ